MSDAGETPLSLAGLSGSFEVMHELLEAGAEPLAAVPAYKAPTLVEGVSPSSGEEAAGVHEQWRCGVVDSILSIFGLCSGRARRGRTIKSYRLGGERGPERVVGRGFIYMMSCICCWAPSTGDGVQGWIRATIGTFKCPLLDKLPSRPGFTARR